MLENRPKISVPDTFQLPCLEQSRGLLLRCLRRGREGERGSVGKAGLRGTGGGTAGAELSVTTFRFFNKRNALVRFEFLPLTLNLLFAHTHVLSNPRIRAFRVPFQPVLEHPVYFPPGELTPPRVIQDEAGDLLRLRVDIISRQGRQKNLTPRLNFRPKSGSVPA